MANDVMLNVSEGFDLGGFSQKLAEMYRMKGYSVTAVSMNKSWMLTFDKGTGGINTLLGLGEGIKATCAVSGNMLSVRFTDAEWTGKIIGLVVGWILCLIPFITAIIGCTRQSKLPKSIANDAMMLAQEFN